MTGDLRCLVLEAKASALHQVLEFVRKGAVEASLPAMRVGELDLLIEEIFMNLCRHAYGDGASGRVTIRYWIDLPDELKVEVSDQGREFNPLTVKSPDIDADLERRPVGGLGIFLVKKFAASLTYRRENGWNRLTVGISASS